MNLLLGIHWEQPWILVLVPLAPLLAWAVFHGGAGKGRALTLPKVLRRWAGARAVMDRPATKRRATGLWLGLGSALVLAALARPQWGNLEETVFDQSREVLIALDLSASMLAERSRAISTSRDWSNTVSSKFPHWGRASAARTSALPSPSHRPVARRLVAGRSMTARAPAQRRRTLGSVRARPFPAPPWKTAHANKGASGTRTRIQGCSQ